jgi:ligand-binding sensor domain-containing protein/serine phosphatase RsbU (regulator of sigma subunit)
MYSRYYILFLFILFSGLLQSQTPHFKTHTLFKGQKGYTVNDAFQDSKGLLWYATSEGLVLYDGVSYKKFTTEDSLASNYISTISEDLHNNLWVGHEKGKISVINDDYQIKKYRDLDTLLTDEVSAIKFLQNGHMLIATLGNGLVDVKDDLVKIYNSETGADDYVYDIELDKKGKIWLATDVGVLCFNVEKNKWSKISMDDGLPDNIVKDLEFDKKGNLWIGMEEVGLAFYDIKTKIINHVPEWNFGNLNHFLVREEGEIWISTKSNGVVKLNYSDYSKFSYKNYLKPDGIISNSTKNLFKDDESNIWIASKEGLSQFTGNLFEILNMNGGSPSNQVYSFIIDSENKYWLACVEGLYVMTTSMTGEFSYQKLLNNDKYKGHIYTSVYQSTNGDVWVGTYGYGIYRFNAQTLAFENYTEKDSLSNNNIISINGDGENIWFSTSGGGVSYLELNEKEIEFKSYLKEDGLGSNYAYSVFKDSKERVWFAKDGGGIALLENGNLESVDQFDTLSNVVYGIVEDRLNNIWFTTANNGLVKYDGKKYHHFTTKDGLITNSFNSIITDEYGNCVLSSNQGVTVINVETNQFVNYTEDDGVAYLSPNLNAIFKDKNGSIWISTANGIIKFNPAIKHKDKSEVKIYITKIQTLDFEITDSISVLNYNENHLVFNYIGLWYKAPENLSYRYKIKGHDVDWIYAQKSLTASYSGLPPGDYTFVVQASVKDGEWNEEQDAEFHFVIESPFWKKWWFIIGVILFIVTGIYLFIKIRVASLKKSEEKLKEEVRRRTAEISKQKDELENNKDIIEQKNKDIMDSIHYAKRIQSAILPSDKIVNEYLKDSFILYKPKDVVAGDFYWMEHKDGTVLFAAADCTGHGVPGAMVSVVCNNALNRSVREYGLTNPGEILDKTRDIIVQEFEKSDEDVKDGMDIALCSLKENILEYSGAHNPLWIIRKGEIIETKANKQPIGQFDNPQPYTTHKFELQKEDVIYIFSDGYVDQFGGAKGKKFKSRAFKELLLSIQDKSMLEQNKIIDDAFETWRGSLEQIDDVCIIGVRV